MNLSLISSRAEREVWGKSVRLRVMHLFFVPGTAPYSNQQIFSTLLSCAWLMAHFLRHN